MTATLQDLKSEREYLHSAINNPDTLEAYPVPVDGMTTGNHRALHAAMLVLRGSGRPVDHLTVCTELQRAQGWSAGQAVAALEEIAREPGYNARGSAGRIKTYAEARRVAEAGMLGASDAHRLDVEAARERFAAAAFGAETEAEMLSARSCMEEAAVVWADISEEASREERGEPTRYIGLHLGRHSETVRLGPGELLTIAAATGVGKSSMALSEMVSLEDRGIKSGLVSVEDGAAKWGSKLIGYRGNVDTSPFWRRPGVNEEGQPTGPSKDDWNRATRAVVEQATKADLIRIVHAKSGTLDEVIQQMAKLARVHGARVLFIDYIQAITVPALRNMTRRDATDYVLARLLSTARVLGVALVVMSQLSRAAKTDRFPEPHLSDLKESGTIENSSDAVVLLWISTDDKDDRSAFGWVFGKVGKYKLDARGDRWAMKRGRGQVLVEDKSYQPGDPGL